MKNLLGLDQIWMLRLVSLHSTGQPLTEALTATNEEFGTARLGALLQDTHGQPVETLPPRVLSAVQ